MKKFNKIKLIKTITIDNNRYQLLSGDYRNNN